MTVRVVDLSASITLEQYRQVFREVLQTPDVIPASVLRPEASFPSSFCILRFLFLFLHFLPVGWDSLGASSVGLAGCAGCAGISAQ
jgi:hypothetical protein